MEFGILGQLRVVGDAGPVRLDAQLQRVLLAVLLCRANRGVPTAVLHDTLWGDHPPKSPGKVLQVYVHRLRRALGDPTRIRHDAAGYALVVHPGELDATRFDALVAEALRQRATGAPDRARDLLREASALWRGKPLGDLADVPVLAADVERLRERYLAACEECADVELELGRHAEIIGELAALVGEHPLRERLRARLMLALYRAGRQAEALAAYDAGRRILADEVGVDPGSELRELHSAMLRARPDLDSRPAARGLPVPRQLPGDVAEFTGREDALRTLDEMTRGSERAPVLITAPAGTAGVGKSALAVHWAYRTADRFPDGQLYANLRGHSAGPPPRPVEVLATFLRALGIAPEKVPVDPDEAAALYRSLLAHRKVLVLLDNAASADQVRPLIPGGAGSLVVITSRHRLSGLVAAQGVRRLSLDVLTPDEAYSLLARVLGAERTEAERDAATALCGLCAHVPLAIRVAAAALLDRPDRAITSYVRELSAGDPEVEAEQIAGREAFDLSYTRLPEDARRLFRLLGVVPGVVPGVDVCVVAAAALADTTPDHAGELLARLVRAHLVDVDAHGRHTFHDLLRLYARERAENEDSSADRQAATQRLYEYYLRTADAAARLVFPQITRLPESVATGPVTGFADRTRALAWLDAERPNLVAAVTHAAEHGPHDSAWLLADTLRGYFFLRRHLTDWLAVADAGLVAARHGGGPREQAASHQHRGLVHADQGRSARAIGDFTEALRLSRRVGWAEGEAAAVANLGNAYSELGQPHRAATHHSRALALYERLDRKGGQADGLMGLGGAQRELGRSESALESHARALSLYRDLGTPIGEGRALGSMATDLAELGRWTEAVEHFTRALDVLRDAGDRDGEATVLNDYAAALCDTGRPETALGHADAALAIAVETGDRVTESSALNTKAEALRLLNRHREALPHLREALELARLIGYRIGEVRALIGLATTHRDLAELDHTEFDRAETCAAEAHTTAERSGHRVLTGRALTLLARIHLCRSRFADALTTANQALEVHRDTGHRLHEAYTLLVLADALRQTGSLDESHRDRALALLADIGSPTP